MSEYSKIPGWTFQNDHIRCYSRGFGDFWASVHRLDSPDHRWVANIEGSFPRCGSSTHLNVDCDTPEAGTQWVEAEMRRLAVDMLTALGAEVKCDGRLLVLPQVTAPGEAAAQVAAPQSRDLEMSRRLQLAAKCTRGEVITIGLTPADVAEAMEWGASVFMLRAVNDNAPERWHDAENIALLVRTLKRHRVELDETKDNVPVKIAGLVGTLEAERQVLIGAMEQAAAINDRPAREVEDFTCIAEQAAKEALDYVHERRAFKLPLLDGMVEALRFYEDGGFGRRRAHLALHNGCTVQHRSQHASSLIPELHECDESYLPQPARAEMLEAAEAAEEK